MAKDIHQKIIVQAQTKKAQQKLNTISKQLNNISNKNNLLSITIDGTTVQATKRQIDMLMNKTAVLSKGLIVPIKFEKGNLDLKEYQQKILDNVQKSSVQLNKFDSQLTSTGIAGAIAFDKTKLSLKQFMRQQLIATGQNDK